MGALYARASDSEPLAMRRRAKIITILRMPAAILESKGPDHNCQSFQRLRLGLHAAFRAHDAKHVVFERQFLRDVFSHQVNANRRSGDRETRRRRERLVIQSGFAIQITLSRCVSVANFISESFEDWFCQCRGF